MLLKWIYPRNQSTCDIFQGAFFLKHQFQVPWILFLPCDRVTWMAGSQTKEEAFWDISYCPIVVHLDVSAISRYCSFREDCMLHIFSSCLWNGHRIVSYSRLCKLLPVTSRLPGVQRPPIWGWKGLWEGGEATSAITVFLPRGLWSLGFSVDWSVSPVEPSWFLL